MIAAVRYAIESIIIWIAFMLFMALYARENAKRRARENGHV